MSYGREPVSSLPPPSTSSDFITSEENNRNPLRPSHTTMPASNSPEAGIPLIEDLSDAPVPLIKKRKRADDAADDDDEKKASRRKKRGSKKPQDVNDESLDSVLGINHAMAHMNSSLMADHVAQRTRRFLPEASLVEMEDLCISEKAIKDTTSFTEVRATEQLPDFLEKFAAPRRKKKKGPKLSDAAVENGSPHTLVIASSGLRAADLTRALRRFQTKDCMVAKLFAKHIKVKEAVEMVRKTRMGIGVGTPQRVIDLLDDGALSARQLERIVIDASHIDQKKRGILDIKEIQLPLVQLLTRAGLKQQLGVGEGKIELVFY